jgi:hypothetical protein
MKLNNHITNRMKADPKKPGFVSLTDKVVVGFLGQLSRGFSEQLA